jgi:choline-sulfatase
MKIHKLILLQFVLLASLGTSHTLFATNNSQQNQKPNILFIMTDQQTAKAMSHRGNPWLNTPNMDRLAQNGTSFTRAYCPQPLCGPSRSSMLTGKYPHEINASINLPEKAGYWSTNIKVMGSYLKDAGYATGYVGKWHLPIPVEDKEHHGFDYITNTIRRDWQDASIPADCGSFLNQKRDQPFFLVASFINPHDICEWARSQKLRMDEISAPPAPENCPPLPANLEIPENEPSFLRKMHKQSWPQYPTVGWEDERWRQYRWAYYRLIEQVDVYIGRVLEALERSGHAGNTIIVFTSDHGDGNGSHRLNQKQVLYEEAANVPFIISHLTKGKFVVDNNTLINVGLDLIPTFCDYAGANIPTNLSGQSIKPFTKKGSKATSREYLFLQTEFAEGEKSFGIHGRAVLNNQYKYIVYSEGENREQLFDLINDPGEMKNLAQDEAYQKTLKEFRKQLSIWQKKHNDKVAILP